MLSTISNYFCISSSPATKKQSLPFQDIKNLDALFQLLISYPIDKWILYKNEIKAIVEAHQNDLDQMNRFLKNITDLGLEKNPQKMFSVIVNIFSLDLLINVVKHLTKGSQEPFTDTFDWATKHENVFLELDEYSLKNKISSEWKRCRPTIFSFIPNVINIFLRAINFLDASKRNSGTLFECNQIMDIALKFLVIPFALVKILEPILIVPAKVYLVSTLIIFTTGILISCYQRWLRPIPDEIVNCKNLSKKMERGHIEPSVGQTSALSQMEQNLEMEENILLVGKSGVGKTALINQLIQRIYEKKVAKKLDFQVFEVDCGAIVASYAFGQSDIINQIKDETKGYEDKILFIFDEFRQIVDNVPAFLCFKKKFAEEFPRSKFIATVTKKEYEKIEKIDDDGSFLRRVNEIKIKSSKRQTKLILREFINRVAADIPFTEEGLKEIITLSSQKDFMPGIGGPAKGLKLLKKALKACRRVYDSNYIPDDLSEALEKYHALEFKRKSIGNDAKTVNKMNDLKVEINNLSNDLYEKRKKILKIKEIRSDQQKILENYYQLNYRAAMASSIQSDFNTNIQNLLNKQKNQANISKQTNTIFKDSINHESQILYLWYSFYAIDAMKDLLKREVDKERPLLPLQIDKQLATQVYTNLVSLKQKSANNSPIKIMTQDSQVENSLQSSNSQIKPNQGHQTSYLTTDVLVSNCIS